MVLVCARTMAGKPAMVAEAADALAKRRRAALKRAEVRRAFNEVSLLQRMVGASIRPDVGRPDDAGPGFRLRSYQRCQRLGTHKSDFDPGCRGALARVVLL